MTDKQRQQLQTRLHDTQTGRCFICDQTIDLALHKSQLEIDHIDPLAENGLLDRSGFFRNPLVFRSKQMIPIGQV